MGAASFDRNVVGRTHTSNDVGGATAPPTTCGTVQERANHLTRPCTMRVLVQVQADVQVLGRHPRRPSHLCRTRTSIYCFEARRATLPPQHTANLIL